MDNICRIFQKIHKNMESPLGGLQPRVIYESQGFFVIQSGWLRVTY